MIVWRGIYKLIEECGEVLQLCGKCGPFPNGEHPDGKGPILPRLEDELADLEAAIRYFRHTNGLDKDKMDLRTRTKLNKFYEWGLDGITIKEE